MTAVILHRVNRSIMGWSTGWANSVSLTVLDRTATTAAALAVPGGRTPQAPNPLADLLVGRMHAEIGRAHV